MEGFSIHSFVHLSTCPPIPHPSQSVSPESQQGKVGLSANQACGTANQAFGPASQTWYQPISLQSLASAPDSMTSEPASMASEPDS